MAYASIATLHEILEAGIALETELAYQRQTSTTQSVFGSTNMQSYATLSIMSSMK